MQSDVVAASRLMRLQPTKVRSNRATRHDFCWFGPEGQETGIHMQIAHGSVAERVMALGGDYDWAERWLQSTPACSVLPIQLVFSAASLPLAFAASEVPRCTISADAVPRGTQMSEGRH